MNRYLISRNKDGKFEPPDDGWVQILAIGDFPNADAGIVQHCDDDSLKAILADFANQAKSENWGGMLTDKDHFSHDKSKETEAMAWIDELERRGDELCELWAHWRLTEVGEKAVRGGSYRFTSPVLGGFIPYDGAPSEKYLRPTKLVRVALTNDPNIKGMAPVSNRGPAEQANTTTTNREGTTMADGINHAALLKELLGLTEGASDEDIQKAIDMLKADAEADTGPKPDNDGDEDTHPAAVEMTANRGEVEALQEEVLALNREIAQVRAENFFSLVGEDKDVRDALVALFAENRDAAMKVFAAVKLPKAESVMNRGANDVRQPFRPAFNRSVQPVPGGDKSDTSTSGCNTMARDIRVEAERLLAANRSNGMTFGQAWTQAERTMANRNNGAGAASTAKTTK